MAILPAARKPDEALTIAREIVGYGTLAACLRAPRQPFPKPDDRPRTSQPVYRAGVREPSQG
jgi:hypothetical protein